MNSIFDLKNNVLSNMKDLVGIDISHIPAAIITILIVMV